MPVLPKKSEEDRLALFVRVERRRMVCRRVCISQAVRNFIELKLKIHRT
jgi:hypothetical protein